METPLTGATREQQARLLRVVSAMLSELPRGALLEPRLFMARLRRLLPALSESSMAAARAADMPLCRLAQLFCHAQDPELACRAYDLAAALLNREHCAARRFLNDLAEWLLIPPPILRDLNGSACSGQTNRAA